VAVGLAAFSKNAFWSFAPLSSRLMARIALAIRQIANHHPGELDMTLYDGLAQWPLASPPRPPALAASSPPP
jgi:hypothetical protein